MIGFARKKTFHEPKAENFSNGSMFQKQITAPLADNRYSSRMPERYSTPLNGSMIPGNKTQTPLRSARNTGG
jgi:hypothetical protein